MSIKKKFVTAVATAGLLAGLFGSALVPAVAARGAYGVTPAVGKSTSWINYGCNDSTNPFDGVLKDISPSVTGGSSGCDDNDYVSRLAMSTYSRNLPSDDNWANARDFSVGFYLEDKNSQTIENADLKATSTGFVNVAWAYDGSSTGKLKACSAGVLDSAYALSDTVTDITSDGDHTVGKPASAGQYYLCLQPVGVTKPGTSTITVTANGVVLSKFTVRVLGDLSKVTLAVTDGYASVAQGNGEIQNFWTVIGYDSAGQQLSGKGADLGYWQYIDNAFGDVNEAGTSYDEVIKHQNGDDLNFVWPGDMDPASDFGVNYTNLPSGACADESFTGAGDGDAGHTFDMAVEVVNWHGNPVESNTVKVTCTGPESTAVVSGFSAELSSGAQDWLASSVGKAAVKAGHGYITIYATLKDASGKPLGVDQSNGDTFDPGYEIVVPDSLTYGAHGDSNYTNYYQVGVGGKLIIGNIIPDANRAAKFEYTVTSDCTQVDCSGTDVEVSSTLSYTVSSATAVDWKFSRTRNAARTQATWTADYGLACSNAHIGFEWENADGSKYGSVTRSANVDGVATFTLNRRNTKIFVYATGCADGDLSTDTTTLAARFK
ncbi:MAG: hypothetical protein WCP38_02975 [Chloroflexota bacterium]